MTPNPLAQPLPEVLYAALQAKPCTRRDLERAAALKGYAAVQVEIALSKARKLGLFVQEPMYRLIEDAPTPEQQPVFVGMDVGEEGGDRTVVTFPAGPRHRGMYWPAVLERVKELRVGDSCVLGRRLGDVNLGVTLSVYLCKWRKKRMLPGTVYRQRSALDNVTVTRAA
ncbi:MAG: hypothetical protein ACRDK7_10710 [Solirubrobacteraceae bacterium]